MPHQFFVQYIQWITKENTHIYLPLHIIRSTQKIDIYWIRPAAIVWWPLTLDPDLTLASDNSCHEAPFKIMHIKLIESCISKCLAIINILWLSFQAKFYLIFNCFQEDTRKIRKYLKAKKLKVLEPRQPSEYKSVSKVALPSLFPFLCKWHN